MRVLPALIAGALLAAPPVAAEESAFSQVRAERGLTLHKEMYILPASWANVYHGSQTEVVYQLSAKHEIFGSRFFLAYSQISFWQAYDKGNSSPFRDTNYNPEVFYRFRESSWHGGRVGVDVGFEHESNGQRVPRSRSWNLVYLAPWYRTGDWLIYFKARYRVPEEAKETPDSPVGDDNPDITDYLGYSDVHLVRLFGDGHQLRLLMRGYLGTDRGLVALTWSMPLPHAGGDAWVCVKFSGGYGESLMDYRRSVTRIGAGIMFNR